MNLELKFKDGKNIDTWEMEAEKLNYTKSKAYDLLLEFRSIVKNEPEKIQRYADDNIDNELLNLIYLDFVK